MELRTVDCDPQLIEDIERSLTRELSPKVSSIFIFKNSKIYMMFVLQNFIISLGPILTL